MTATTLERHKAGSIRRASVISWRRLRWVALSICVLTLVAGAAIGHQLLMLRGDLLAARQALDNAGAAAESILAEPETLGTADETIEAATSHLREGDRALASAAVRTRRLRVPFALAGRLPGWPGGAGEIEELVAAARGLTLAGIALSDAYAALSVTFDDTPDDRPTGARLADGLTDAEPSLIEAHDQVQRALIALRGVDRARLTGPLAPAGAALETFDRRAGAVEANLDLLVELPAAARTLLGVDGPRTYAVLGQNSAELRPTGGFIGSMGIVRIQDGAIVEQDYRSSYLFDDPSRGYAPLPEAMASHLGFTGWAVRDANWSPDFPTSARTLESLLAHHTDIRVDGVVGFTTFAVGELLETVGPLRVEGFAEPVTAETWYGLAERQIYFSEGETGEQADELYAKGAVLEPLLRATLDRIQGADLEEMPAIARTLGDLVRRRELMVSFHDPAPAALARRYGADGRLAPPERGDVLALVDANLSYSKVSPYVEQRIRYEVWLNERGVATRSQVTVDYDNQVTPELVNAGGRRIGGVEMDRERGQLVRRPGVYGTYARTYVPAKSRPIAEDGAQLPEVLNQELGFTVLEAYRSIPASSRRSFTYAYQIPVNANPPGEYNLTVIKQPGTEGHELTVMVHLPPGVSADPNVAMTREGDALVYRGDLTETLSLAMRLGVGGR